MNPLEAWWVIRGGEIMLALIRVQDGENPALMFLELVANSEAEEVPGDPGAQG